MKQLLWVSAILALTASLPISGLAQTPPAKTYQPGYWQPIARINPQQPVSIVIVNQSGLPLEYGLTAERPVNKIPIGETTRVNSKPLPMYLLINPQKAEQVGLTFDVAIAEGNTVTVTVRTLADTQTPGDNALNFDKTGAIYVQ
jgi:hypothetical protein